MIRTNNVSSPFAGLFIFLLVATLSLTGCSADSLTGPVEDPIVQDEATVNGGSQGAHTDTPQHHNTINEEDVK